MTSTFPTSHSGGFPSKRAKNAGVSPSYPRSLIRFPPIPIPKTLFISSPAQPLVSPSSDAISRPAVKQGATETRSGQQDFRAPSDISIPGLPAGGAARRRRSPERSEPAPSSCRLRRFSAAAAELSLQADSLLTVVPWRRGSNWIGLDFLF